MHVATGMVDHAAGIDLGADVLANGVAIEQFVIVHAIALPQRLLGFEIAHVLISVGGVDIAALQVALDGVAIDPVIDDPGAFLHHAADEGGGFKARIETVDHLTAVATRRAPANLGTLHHHDLEAMLGQMNGGGKPGIAGPDDADVGRHLAFKFSRLPDDIARGGVIARWIGAVAGIGFFGHHTTSR
jgi:hypothetical protein